MKNLVSLAIIVVLLLTLAQGCKKEPDALVPITRELNLPETPYEYNKQQLPQYAHQVNDLSNDKATLGRVLFYDNILSLNNAVSCASCHKQTMAFADGQQFSRGFAGKHTPRNSMAIINPRRENALFWDLRESSLRSMVTKPVQNHIEMGFDSMWRVVEKIKNTKYYPELFRNAFGTEEVTEVKIQEALEQFLGAMATYNSKYDQGVTNGFSNFTQQEHMGAQLFEDLMCSSCHGRLEASNSWMMQANIGLDEDYEDEGIGAGNFKIPSLRNVALTGPYMHDGRFKTLEEVVEHYNSGVKDHPNLNWELRDNNSTNPITQGQPVRHNLNQVQKDALVAFLNTFTDKSFIADNKFSNPFQN